MTPFRIEGQLARGLTMSTGQLVNWDVLTMLTPEMYWGRQPKTKEELDAHEQVLSRAARFGIADRTPACGSVSALQISR